MVAIPYHTFAILNFERISDNQLLSEPFQWSMIDALFDQTSAQELAQTYPIDHYKTVDGYDGEKGYRYEVRSLITMGQPVINDEKHLSLSWRLLAKDLLSDEYRIAMSKLTGIDLTVAPLEVNVFHYEKGAWMGPHVDLKDKIVTHVLYFNEDWNLDDGGCLAILRSKNLLDSYFMVPPNVGNSAIIVRSNYSWHAVMPVSTHCKTTRRSVTVTFYHPGSVSTMWPPGFEYALHDYSPNTEFSQ